jgi:RNA polymerase sigma-70 factor (ECF subfamily)
VRVALHQLRRRRTERQRTAPLSPELHLVHSHSEGPDDYTLRRQAARYLDQLPDEQRQAVVLHHVLGQSVPELAESLSVPFETARSRLRLGMEKLRARLAKRGQP